MAIGTSPLHQATGSWSSGTSYTVTVTAPTNGNMQVLFAQGTAQITSITQTGATWLNAITQVSGKICEIWYSLNVSGAGTTITVNLGAGPGVSNAASVSEWAVPASMALDVDFGGTTGASNPLTKSTTPVAGRNTLIIAATRTSAATTGPTGGFTALTSPDAGSRDFGAYQVVTTASGSYQASWTAAGVYGAAIASFIAPAPAVPSVLITQQPTTVASGVAFSPAIGVAATTDGSTIDTAFQGNCVVSIASGTSGSLSATTFACVNGVPNLAALTVTGDGAYTLTFTMSGYTAATSSTVYVKGAATLAAMGFVAAAGGDSGVPNIKVCVLNRAVVSGGVTDWADAIGTIGGRTPGQTCSQAGAASLRPTIDVDGGIKFDGAQFQHLVGGQESRCTPVAATPYFKFTCAKVTADGPISVMVSDPTNAALFPVLGVVPAAGNWKGLYAPTSVGDTIAPDSNVAWNDGVIRVAGCGKSTNAAAGVGNGNTPWHLLFGGRQYQNFLGQPNATTVSGGLKPSIGRWGTSYFSGTVYAECDYTGTDLQTAWKAWEAYCLAQFPGTALETSKSRSIAFWANSLFQGKQSSNPLTTAIGSGTTTPVYICAHTNTGRGTFAAQGFATVEIHEYNYSVSGRNFDQMIAQFAGEIAPLADGNRAGPGVVVCWDITNQIINVGSSAAVVLARITTLCGLVRGIGLQFATATTIDRITNYTAGVLNTDGQKHLDVNTGLRLTPPGPNNPLCDFLWDPEADPSNNWKINLGGTKAYLNPGAVIYDPDGTHQTDLGYLDLGVSLKVNLFDANDAMLYPGRSSSRIQVGIGIGL